jgi:hypothetical protein
MAATALCAWRGAPEGRTRSGRQRVPAYWKSDDVAEVLQDSCQSVEEFEIPIADGVGEERIVTREFGKSLITDTLRCDARGSFGASGRMCRAGLGCGGPHDELHLSPQNLTEYLLDGAAGNGLGTGEPFESGANRNLEYNGASVGLCNVSGLQKDAETMWCPAVL